MNWLQAYRVRQCVRDSLWMLPAVGMVAAMASIRLLIWVDGVLPWESGSEIPHRRLKGVFLEAIRYTNIGTLKTAVSWHETRRLCPVQRTNPLIQGHA